MILRPDDPLARETIRAIKSGDLEALQEMFTSHGGLSAARIKDNRGSKALLHVVTDWPGFFPNGPAVVKLLIAAGANPNVSVTGHLKTSQRWAVQNQPV